MLKIHTKVEMTYNNITGQIIGYGFMQRNETLSAYLVQLDEGFYDPTKTLFVSTIVASPDNVKEIKKTE